MSPTKILQEKKTIIHQLEKTNDEELLHEIYLLIESRNKEMENPFSPEELLKRAKQSEVDIQNGNVITLNELKELTKKWHGNSNI